MDNTPVAMPAHFGYELCGEPFTLEDYFKGLQKFVNDDAQESSVKSGQIGGDHYQKAALQPWDIFLAWGPCTLR